MERRYVSYLRVSTARQGQSGLGIEAQRRAVEDYLNGGSWELLAEYVEEESGKNDQRPQLQKALHHAKVTGSRLVVAKLDRLSRNAAFLFALMESKVPFVCADMPEANETTIGIMAVIAQTERKAISDRTKKALEAAKKRGVKLGNPNGAQSLRRAGKGNSASVKANKDNADSFARDIMPVIEDIRASGVSTLYGIAKELNKRGIRTVRGGHWYARTVANLLERIEA